MSRLIVSLPPLEGTSGSDLVVGQEDNALPAIGIEVLKNGVIDTQASNDTIEGSGTGGNGLGGTGTGIANSGTINAGKGDDTISGTGTGGREDSRGDTAPAIGISNTQGGYINGGDGKDSIKGTGRIGIDNALGSRIDGGFGDDFITGTVLASDLIFDFGTKDSAEGISNTEGSDINGGEGNDSIQGTGTGGFLIGADGIGIFNSGASVISGGKGNDSIIGIGYGGDGYLDPNRQFEPGRGIGISNSEGSTISGGQGNDFISGTGTGVAGQSQDFVGKLAPSVGIGIINSGTISLGDGNDTIIGTGISLGTGILNTNAIISSGAGDDTLTGYGTSIGIQGGTIDGGKGNDYFKARRIDDSGNPVSDQGGAIADVVIKGGYGADTFDVGYGNATIDGGSGSDKLILPDFKSDYTILGSSNNYTIKRDQFTLNVLNVEEIAFFGVPPQDSVQGITL